MKLYFARHGEALSKAQDPHRPLSAKGIEDIQRLALFLEKSRLKVQDVSSSSVLRAKQTAEILNQHIGPGKINTLMCLEPEADIKDLLYALDKFQPNTLLVGHLPNIELLCNHLINESIHNKSIHFLPGDIACLENTGTQWELRWFIQPNLMD